MYKWLAIPMVRASMAFGLGVFLGLPSALNIRFLESLWLGIFLIYFLSLNLSRWRYGWERAVLFLLAFILVMIAGVIRSRAVHNAPQQIVGAADCFYATVCSPTVLHGNYYRTTLVIRKVWVESIAYEIDNRILIYQPSKEYHNLNYGDRLLIAGSPRRIQAAANPREFDYGRFMARKNVFWYHWLDSDQIFNHMVSNTFSVSNWSHQISEVLMGKLKKYLPPGVSQEITGAMLLGNRAGVGDSTEEAFARSGTIHVLAVSGLHLGILYWILLQGFGRWRRRRLFKWPFIAVCLLVLWTFTIITGMAASTQRAATMFSILLLGNALNIQSNTVNTLAVAAIVILWFDPYQLCSVGFQLSFMALGGILYLQPWICSWWTVSNKVLNYFWQLSSVSLAAQIMVLPLSAYYFHQLPVYFLVSNLALIPLTFAIIMTGMVFFLTSMSHFLSGLTAQPLDYLSDIAAYLVQLIADLPGSTLQNLYIEYWELFLWYGLLITLVSFLRTRVHLWWHLFLCLTLISTTNHIYRRVKVNQRQMVVVYHVPGHTAIDLIEKDNFYTIMDPELLADSASVKYKISHFRKYLNLNNSEQPVLLWTTGTAADLWKFKGKLILLIKESSLRSPGAEVKLKSHITIVSNNAIHPDQINSLDTDLLIIDGSNRRAYAQKLEKQAGALGINTHNVWSEGYKIINL